MAHYDDEYDKMHEQEYQRKAEANRCQKDLMNLPHNQMVKIMFEGYLKTLHDNDIIEISKKYCRRGPVNL